MWWEEAVLRDRWDLESKASFWEVLESSNSEIVANYITFAASNYCRGQDTTERQTPRATESGRNYKAGRRKINQRQLRGSRSKHILGNTKSLGSSTLRDFHWGAAHFPSQSPLYRWDLDGAGHISRLCPANCTQETECTSTKNFSLHRFARVATSELSSWLHFITRSHAFQNPGNLIWWDGNFNCTTNLRTWGLFINDVFTGEGRGGGEAKRWQMMTWWRAGGEFDKD